MKKTKHEAFLQELRTPVLRVEEAQCSRKTSETIRSRSSSTSGSHTKRPDGATSGENSDLMAELEAKFDALFGNLDDDDD